MDPLWREGWRTAAALALQHHPLCQHFHADRFRIGRAALCSGCAMAFPGLFLGATSGLLGIVLFWWPAPATLAAGLFLGIPQLATYFIRFGRPTRAAIKLLGGAGLGLASVAWWLLPVAWGYKVAGASLLALAFGGMQWLRMRSILRTCRACPWQADWDRCPGFNASHAQRAAGAAAHGLEDGWTLAPTT